jgi:2-succinyl-6-hydroxy-2,4-cyclohexadiene-1-carboxylate synthase
VTERAVVRGVPFVLRPAAGRPGLVLLHGFTGSPHSWDEVSERLAGAASLAAPWLPGHDGNPGWFRGDRFDEVTDAIARALRALRPGRWHVAGYSLGGRVALSLAVRHPGLIGSVAAIGASAGLRSERERHERREADARWARMLREEGLASFLAAWAKLPLFASQRALPQESAAAQRAIRASHDPRGLARSLEVLGLAEMPDLWPALPEVRVPVLLVSGALDAKFTALSAEMAAALPAARRTTVAGAGHNVVFEAPDEVAALLRGEIGGEQAGEVG